MDPRPPEPTPDATPDPVDHQVICPGCRAAYGFAPDQAGRLIHCRCGRDFLIPQASPDSEQEIWGQPAPAPVLAPGQERPTWTDQELISCPRCAKLIAADTVVCTLCGFDTRTGFNTRIETDKPPPPPPPPLRQRLRKEGLEAVRDREAPLAVMAVAAVMAGYNLYHHTLPAMAIADLLLGTPVKSGLMFMVYLGLSKMLSLDMEKPGSVILRLGAVILLANALVPLPVTPEMPNANSLWMLAGYMFKLAVYAPLLGWLMDLDLMECVAVTVAITLADVIGTMLVVTIVS